MGLAWAPSADRKTVVRAGAGLFYELLISPNLDAERAALGPPGLGRQTFSGSSILNPLPGIPGVPLGRPLDFRGTPTLFTGADLMTILPTIRASLTQSLSNADPSVQAIQISKQASGAACFLPTIRGPGSALYTSLGIQREIARDFVVSADLVYRHFVHLDLGGVGGGIDLNHFNSIRGPVIPVCTCRPAERSSGDLLAGADQRARGSVSRDL